MKRLEGRRTEEAARAAGYVPTDEALEFVKFSRTTLCRLGQRGHLNPIRVGRGAFWLRRELGEIVSAGLGQSGLVEARWAAGKKAGVHVTLDRLRAEGKLTSKDASALIGVSPFILHGVKRETLPYTEDGPYGCRVYLTANLEHAREQIRAEHCPHTATEGTLAVSEAADDLKITIYAVYANVKRGCLAANKRGKPMRITIESVEQYKRERLPRRGAARQEALDAETLSRRDVAKRLGYSPSTIRELIGTGALPTTSKERVGWESRVDVATVDAMLAAKHPCACGCGTLIFPWATIAPGHYLKMPVGSVYPGAHKALHRRIDEALAAGDIGEARRWRQLAAGLLVRWSRFKEGVHTPKDMRADAIVAHGVAKRAPHRVIADELGVSVGAVGQRLRKLNDSGATHLAKFVD